MANEIAVAFYACLALQVGIKNTLKAALTLWSTVRELRDRGGKVVDCALCQFRSTKKSWSKRMREPSNLSEEGTKN